MKAQPVNPSHVPAPDRSPAALPGRLQRARIRARDFFAHLRYDARLSLGWMAVALVGFAAIVAVANGLRGNLITQRSVYLPILLVEVASFIALCVGLLPREREADTLEVLLTTGRSRHALLLMKFIPVALFVAAIALAQTVAYYWMTSGAFPFLKMLLVPYLLGMACGILAIVLSTYFRNQYAAGIVTLVVVLAIGTGWLDPMHAFYGNPSLTPVEKKPNFFFNYVFLIAPLILLYFHAVGRLKQADLWTR